jgi:hypothetical protein
MCVMNECYELKSMKVKSENETNKWFQIKGNLKAKTKRKLYCIICDKNAKWKLRENLRSDGVWELKASILWSLPLPSSSFRSRCCCELKLKMRKCFINQYSKNSNRSKAKSLKWKLKLKLKSYKANELK